MKASVDELRRVAADLLRQGGDEEGARVVERTSTPWEVVEIEDNGRRTGLCNVVRDDGGPSLEFAPNPTVSVGFSRADAEYLAAALNRLTQGV